MNLAFMYRVVKSKLTELANKPKGPQITGALNVPNSARPDGGAEAPNDENSTNARRKNRTRYRGIRLTRRPANDELPSSIRTHYAMSYTEPEATSTRARTLNARTRTRRRRSVLPTQESVISALYGVYEPHVTNRFPVDASMRHDRRRTRRRHYEMPPVPPYHCVDPEPELSAPLRDLQSCEIFYLPAEPCPTYSEVVRRRRRQRPMVEL